MPPDAPLRRPSVRPQVEALEERNLLNSRFVVPAAYADNVTNFTTLQAALTTPGLNPGDVIQIESYSSPGGLSGGDIPAVADLTVRGDASNDIDPTAATVPPVAISWPGKHRAGPGRLHLRLGQPGAHRERPAVVHRQRHHHRFPRSRQRGDRPGRLVQWDQCGDAQQHADRQRHPVGGRIGQRERRLGGERQRHQREHLRLHAPHLRLRGGGHDQRQHVPGSVARPVALAFGAVGPRRPEHPGQYLQQRQLRRRRHRARAAPDRLRRRHVPERHGQQQHHHDGRRDRHPPRSGRQRRHDQRQHRRAHGDLGRRGNPGDFAKLERRHARGPR